MNLDRLCIITDIFQQHLYHKTSKVYFCVVLHVIKASEMKSTSSESFDNLVFTVIMDRFSSKMLFKKDYIGLFRFVINASTDFEAISVNISSIHRVLSKSS